MSGELRIIQHPILDVLKERKIVKIYFNGKEIEAFEDEPIAAALFAAGIKVLRHTPIYGDPRGVFCNRGRCTDCIMTVNGKPNVRTCVTRVKDSMVIESLEGLGKWVFDE